MKEAEPRPFTVDEIVDEVAIWLDDALQALDQEPDVQRALMHAQRAASERNISTGEPAPWVANFFAFWLVRSHFAETDRAVLVDALRAVTADDPGPLSTALRAFVGEYVAGEISDAEWVRRLETRPALG